MEKIRHLVNDYKAGKIRYEGLNTFNKSLEEYFLFRLYELRAVQFSGEISDESIQDSFSLPVYSNEAITLKNVSVFGFPGLKKGGNSVFIAGESSSKEFKLPTERTNYLYCVKLIIHEYTFIIWLLFLS